MAEFKKFHRGKLEILRKIIKSDKTTVRPRMRCCHGNGLNPEMTLDKLAFYMGNLREETYL